MALTAKKTVGIGRWDGAACVYGTRIAVTNVLGVLRLNRAVEKVVQKYHPTLTGRQIHEAIYHAIQAVTRSDAAWIARETRKQKNAATVEKAQARKRKRR